jgi:hypothetical protein
LINILGITHHLDHFQRWFYHCSFTTILIITSSSLATKEVRSSILRRLWETFLAAAFFSLYRHLKLSYIIFLAAFGV